MYHSLKKSTPTPPILEVDVVDPEALRVLVSSLNAWNKMADYVLAPIAVVLFLALTFTVRRALRKQTLGRQSQGRCCVDCLATFCCPICALFQMQAHVDPELDALLQV